MPVNEHRSDFLIIGSGIIGLALARELAERYPGRSITVIEKESAEALHGSGRNSGVLHAGFYYTANSLKARFTRDGNRELTAYCEKHGLAINKCRKVVVAKNEAEVEGLRELERRGRTNGVAVSLIDEKELREIDPNAKTTQFALYSPATATVDPVEVCGAIRRELEALGVSFLFNCPYVGHLASNSIRTPRGVHSASMIINAAGLYADRVARDFGFGLRYVIVPFKGIYLKYRGAEMTVSTNIYPVPNLNNPFLGVHFTVTVDGTVKIGPTAIPAFWRENYRGLDNFMLDEFFQVLCRESILFARNSFGFRSLALEEMRKYRRGYFVSMAANLVHRIDRAGFREWSRPGIRAQLLDVETSALVQDFVVEGDRDSVHVLNAVSPAFTGSFPFCRWVVDEYIAPALA
ncbi:MAG TPA: L-2-hydroxyglutarate oxidase [Spirochaetota bacterium]|nr:L-2-hydroxyglutarate oxidase [Spirochaetota bacterium]HNT11665.1 L-2-hydroxyglutarate oxidase [Spirochaetota bacterium]